MVFKKKDANINRKGRPSVENQKTPRDASQQIRATELRKSVVTLRNAVPKALQLLIDAMEDPDIPMKDKLKYGKDVYDLYLKSVGMDASLKKAKKAMNQTSPETGNLDDNNDEDESVEVPAVVFTLHQTKKE